MSNTNDDSTPHSQRRAIVLLFRLTVWVGIFGIVAFSVSIKAGLITAAIMAGFYVMTTAFGSRSETLSLAAGTKLDERAHEHPGSRGINQLWTSLYRLGHRTRR